jgi:molecular chaperone HtpG
MAAESTPSAAEANVEERAFQTEVQQLLQILIHSLYTNSEVFLRELVSNASDALDKARFRSLTDSEIVDPDAELEIDISVDAEAKTLTIRDSGIGMSRDEVNQNIGTIAHSGSAALAQKLAEAKDADEKEKLQLIGQFGVGFYAVFMVAERVVLTSRSADPSAEAVLWESTGDGNYTVSTSDRQERGTEIKIYVRSDCEEYLDAHRLEGIVKRHSDYISYPVKVADKQANSASALWTRPRSEISQEQYEEFFTHLTGVQEKPLAYEHVAVDMPIQFSSILYIPRQSPMEVLFNREPKIQLNLHIKRVFIQDDCNELLPMYLRFVRGIVDADDLPLNVSREVLQNNPVVTRMRSVLVKRVLGALEKMAKDRPDDYKVFWESYGTVLKEGVAMEHESRDELAALLRFSSSLEDDAATQVSLQDYVDRAQDGQEVIYYLTGENRQTVTQSPVLEAFRKRGLEVLFMTDPVDEWVVNTMQDFGDKKFQAADAEEVELEEEKKLEGVEDASDKERTIELVGFLKKELESRVSDVRESQRLTDSPSALVTPKGSMSHNMERLMRMSDQEFQGSKRILEINPKHPAVRNLGDLLKIQRDDPRLGQWAHLLVDYVLLGEGTVEDPQRVVSSLQSVMSAASGTLVGDSTADDSAAEDTTE